TRTARIHHVRQPRRSRSPGAQPHQAHEMTTPLIRPRIRLQPETEATFAAPQRAADRVREAVFDVHDLDAYYGGTVPAIADVSMKMYRGMITALIGPSGCGKSTFIRSLNRMNDSIPGFRVEGRVLYHGHDIYTAG